MKTMSEEDGWRRVGELGELSISTVEVGCSSREDVLLFTPLWSELVGNSLMAFLRIIHLRCSSADLLMEIN